MIATKGIKETILEELKTKDIVCIPASEEDFLTVVTTLPFKIEFWLTKTEFKINVVKTNRNFFNLKF